MPQRISVQVVKTCMFGQFVKERRKGTADMFSRIAKIRENDNVVGSRGYRLQLFYCFYRADIGPVMRIKTKICR